MKRIKLLLLPFLAVFLISSDIPSYKIFDKNGDQSSFSDLKEAAINADIVLFGELHNNAIAHWLQLELTKAIYQEKAEKLVLGAEMFEADDQVKIDEYLDGLISQKSFEKETRLWNNYKTDYKPLMEFAKSNNLDFIATNIPRRYASIVSKKGLDSLKLLSKEALKNIAPLPIEYDSELPGYKSMAKMGMGHGMKHIAEAQASKDATMAFFIVENMKKGDLFLHYNGTYHSKDFEGINWYLKKHKKNLKIVTINTVTQENINLMDEKHLNSADFIIVVDEDVTKTY